MLNGVFANEASNACCCSGLIAKGFAPKLKAGMFPTPTALTGGATGALPDRKLDCALTGGGKSYSVSTLCWAILMSPPAGFF
jgi:hypothetical protein